MKKTIDDIRKEAYAKAEAHYQAFHNEHGERIRPYGHFDESRVVLWGRLWLLSLVLRDYMNDQIDPGGPSFEEMLHDANTADYDRVLEGMYG